MADPAPTTKPRPKFDLNLDGDHSYDYSDDGSVAHPPTHVGSWDEYQEFLNENGPPPSGTFVSNDKVVKLLLDSFEQGRSDKTAPMIGHIQQGNSYEEYYRKDDPKKIKESDLSGLYGKNDDGAGQSISSHPYYAYHTRRKINMGGSVSDYDDDYGMESGSESSSYAMSSYYGYDEYYEYGSSDSSNSTPPTNVSTKSETKKSRASDSESKSKTKTKTKTKTKIRKKVKKIKSRRSGFGYGWGCGPRKRPYSLFRMMAPKNTQSGKTRMVMRGSTGLLEDKEEFKKLMMEHAEVACFGDVMSAETRVDASVRSGFDVTLETLIENGIFKITPHFAKILKYHFSIFSGRNHIDVVPYKINYYGPGDHFIDHKDSPDTNLIGTIVWRMFGETNRMVLTTHEGEEIRWGHTNDLLMFFPETTHRVEPISEGKERWTMTFKVFIKPEYVPKPNESPSLTKFKDRITKPRVFRSLSKDHGFQGCTVGVVLRHGYSFMGIDDTDSFLRNLKGIDHRFLLDALALVESGDFEMHVAPVVIGDVIKFSKGRYRYHDSATDSDDDDTVLNASTSRKKINRDPAINGSAREIRNVPRALLDIINSQLKTTDESKMFSNKKFGGAQMFFMGKGFELGRVTRTGLHVGNYSTGSTLSSIYFNFAIFLVGTKKGE